MRRITFGILFLLALVLPAAAQDATPASPDSDRCFENNGVINEDSGECQRRMHIDLVMDYPLELSDYLFIRDAVDTYYEQVRFQFLNNATESGFVPSPVYNWELYMSYDILTQTDSLVSVIFYNYEYTGGAHGMTWLNAMTFDLATGTQLTLTDLFPDGIVPYDTFAAYSATTLQDRLGADATFPEGYTADPDNFQFWTLGEDGLTLYFPAYQVAPYAAGIQTVTIPFDELGIAVPGYFSGS